MIICNICHREGSHISVADMNGGEVLGHLCASCCLQLMQGRNPVATQVDGEFPLLSEQGANLEMKAMSSDNAMTITLPCAWCSTRNYVYLGTMDDTSTRADVDGFKCAACSKFSRLPMEPGLIEKVDSEDDLERCEDGVVGGSACQPNEVVFNTIDDKKEREAQRRSFAFGNANLSNPNVTRDDVDKAAEEMESEE